MKNIQITSFKDDKARVVNEFEERKFINFSNAQCFLISAKDLLNSHKRSIGIFLVMSAIVLDLEAFSNAF